MLLPSSDGSTLRGKQKCLSISPRKLSPWVLPVFGNGMLEEHMK